MIFGKSMKITRAPQRKRMEESKEIYMMKKLLGELKKTQPEVVLKRTNWEINEILNEEKEKIKTYMNSIKVRKNSLEKRNLEKNIIITWYQKLKQIWN